VDLFRVFLEHFHHEVLPEEVPAKSHAAYDAQWPFTAEVWAVIKAVHGNSFSVVERAPSDVVLRSDERAGEEEWQGEK
jgi:hypothetical protein